MKALLILLLLIPLVVSADGGVGTPIYLDVTISFSRDSLPDMNCINNALIVSGWGLESQNITRDTVTMRWVDHIMSLPDLQGTQQQLAACETKGIDIRAVLSGVLLP